MTNAEKARELALQFFARVWTPPHDLDAINELMTPDYKITTAGKVVEGRDAFKAWVAAMQSTITDATNQHIEILTTGSGSHVISRWITRGKNNGIFGLPAKQEPITFTGIAIWRIENDRLAECWVERSAFELFEELRPKGR